MRYVLVIIMCIACFACDSLAQDSKNKKDKGKNNNIGLDYPARIAELEKQHKLDSDALLKMQKKLKLSDSIEVDFSNMVVDYANKLKTISYRQLDSSEFANVINLLIRYSDMNDQIQAASDNLKPYYYDYLLYKRVLGAVNSKYDKAAVESLIEPLKTLKQGASGTINAADIDTLYTQLTLYEEGVLAFKRIITTIEADNLINKQTTSNGRFNLIPVLLDNLETDYGSITSVQRVSWLAKTYKKYYDDLKTMPSQQSTVRDEILSIVN